MSQIKFTNFAHTTLAAGVTDTDTTISVAGGQGNRFPVIGTLEYFYATLENAALQREIVKVTARSADTFTVVRGQDNTTAASWNAGDTLALRLNAAAIEDALSEVATGTVSIKRFSGDGVTTAFTLDDAPAVTQNVDVFIGGVYQNHDTFSVSGVTLTFTEAPTEGTNNIETRVYLPVGVGSTNASLVTYTPAGTGAVATNVQAKLREFVSVKDFGAVGDGVTDDTVAIQAAMDSAGFADTPLTVWFPATSASYAISTTLIIKNSNLHLVGLGGRVTIKYIGTGAAALPMIRAYKDTDHGGENYKNVRLKNLKLDGNNLALRCLDVYGFTRRCGADECAFTAAVMPLKVRDGFYSSWNNIEVHETPLTAPAGMAGATYAANLYGIYLEVCHIASFKNLVMFAIGGNVSNPYTATFYAYISEGLSVQSYTIEEGQQSAHGRYVTDVLKIDPSVTVHFDSAYIEGVQASNDLIVVGENAVARFTNSYFNDIKAVDFLSLNELGQVVFDNTFGEAFDIQDRLFKSNGSNIFGLQFVGGTSFAAGSLTSGDYNANGTTHSKQGLICDPILTSAGASAAFNGYRVSGYSVSIVGDDVVVAPGVYHLNGQTVQFGRNPNSDQLLRPDLSVAATWNVRISGAGTPYIERQSATKVGSAYNPIIATFTTAGGGAAPAGLTSFNTPVTRITGAVDKPLGTNFRVNQVLTGEALLLDSGTASFSDLLTLTLSAAGGEDDAISVVIKYFATTTGGGSRSVEVGQVFIPFTREAGGTVVAGTPVKNGTAQALTPGMSSMTTTFQCSVSGSVCTVQMRNETSADAATRVLFEAHVMGGVRAAARAALASGVTYSV